MSAALLATRLPLAADFEIAGPAKLRDHTGALRALADFGAPAKLIGPLAVLLPAAELGLRVAIRLANPRLEADSGEVQQALVSLGRARQTQAARAAAQAALRRERKHLLELRNFCWPASTPCRC